MEKYYVVRTRWGRERMFEVLTNPMGLGKAIQAADDWGKAAPDRAYTVVNKDSSPVYSTDWQVTRVLKQMAVKFWMAQGWLFIVNPFQATVSKVGGLFDKYPEPKRLGAIFDKASGVFVYGDDYRKRFIKGPVSDEERAVIDKAYGDTPQYVVLTMEELDYWSKISETCRPHNAAMGKEG
jgi:hypothetical protein